MNNTNFKNFVKYCFIDYNTLDSKRINLIYNKYLLDADFVKILEN